MNKNFNIVKAIKLFSEYYPEYQIISVMLWDQTDNYERYRIHGKNGDNEFIDIIRINL